MSGDADAWAKARLREFDYPGVRDLLADVPLSQLIDWFKDPVPHIVYAEPLGNWRTGDGRPELADDDPAVMQAIGRCAASRVRRNLPFPTLDIGRVHPGTCGWCDYPLKALLAACDWATWHSRYIVSETLSWYQKTDKRTASGDEYHRPGRSGVYTHPVWAAFWELPPDEREARVQAVQYPAVPA